MTIKGIKNNYCCTCGKFYNVLIPQCPECKERSDLVETYHLQKGDRVFTTGCYLRWNGKQFILDEIVETIYYDGEVQFDNKQKPFVIL